MNCVNCSKETKNPRFCSRSCNATYNNRVNPKRKGRTKKCIFCDKEYPERTRNKLFCSRKCKNDHKLFEVESSGKFPLSWNNNRYIRKYLVTRHGNCCQICQQSGDDWKGKPLTLTVDHIDGKADNQSIDNLRLVCPNCDSQLLTFKGRNKGNSTRKFTITQK
jgi:hypothetical protein